MCGEAELSQAIALSNRKKYSGPGTYSWFVNLWICKIQVFLFHNFFFSIFQFFFPQYSKIYFNVFFSPPLHFTGQQFFAGQPSLYTTRILGVHWSLNINILKCYIKICKIKKKNYISNGYQWSLMCSFAVFSRRNNPLGNLTCNYSIYSKFRI